ncbi:hypothetical protein GQ55_7G038600 [Panicum hallii var. hallii]|uniref:Uncharacterized protein n=1 Tax=Panicum hallii var. hallii TaxID=1504633 RepID=A0A2T7CSB6_9POAL|nr:hypothetical protein GQ55_7G038600 [Panicum hallii var. hallii]
MGPLATSQASGTASMAATAPSLPPTVLAPSTMAVQSSGEVDTDDGLNVFDEMPPRYTIHQNCYFLTSARPAIV